MKITELLELWRQKGDAALTSERICEPITDEAIPDGVNPAAVTNIGVKIYNLGYEKNAAVLFRMAAEGGAYLGKYYFGYSILEGLVAGSKPEEGLRFLTDEEVLKKTDASYLLYQIYRDGKYGFAENPDKEKEYFDYFFGLDGSGHYREYEHVSTLSEKRDDLESALDKPEGGYIHKLDFETLCSLFSEFARYGKADTYLSGIRLFKGIGTEWNYRKGINAICEASGQGFKKATAFLEEVIREGRQSGQYESYEKLKARFECKKDEIIKEIGEILFDDPRFYERHPAARRLLDELPIEIRDSVPAPLPFEFDMSAASHEKAAMGITALRAALDGKPEYLKTAECVDGLDKILRGQIKDESEMTEIYRETERLLSEAGGILPEIPNTLAEVFINVRAIKSKERIADHPRLGTFDFYDADHPRIVLYVGTIKKFFPHSPDFEDCMLCSFVHEMIHALHYALIKENGGVWQNDRPKDRLLAESIARGGEAMYCSGTLGNQTLKDRFLAEFTLDDARIWPYAGARYLIGTPKLLGAFSAKSITDWEGACDDLLALRRVRDSIPGLSARVYLPPKKEPVSSKRIYPRY